MSDVSDQEKDIPTELPNSQLIFGKDLRLVVKSLVLLVFSGAIGWQVINFDTTKITVDFATLISVLLALFSIALAVAFYHMANISSQKFYADTFAFTKGIAESLAKIDSGFSEKLQNLYVNYENIRTDYAQLNLKGLKVEKGKEKLEEANEEREQLLLQKDKIISDLMIKAQVDEKQKADIQKKLYENQKELNRSENQIRRQNLRIKLAERLNKDKNLDFDNYMKNVVFPMFELEPIVYLNSSPQKINDIFRERVIPRLSDSVIQDLINLNFYDGIRITKKGWSYFGSVARNI